LGDVHEVHLEFAHLGVGHVVGHVVQTLLGAVGEVLHLLEALELGGVVAGGFEVFHLLFCRLEYVFHRVELCPLGLKVISRSDLGSNLGVNSVVLAEFRHVLESVYVVPAHFAVALDDVFVSTFDVGQFRQHLCLVEIVPLLELDLFAQTVVLNGLDQVEVLHPPVRLGQVLLGKQSFQVLAVDLAVLIGVELLDVGLELVLGLEDLALVGLQFLQELADFDGQLQVFRVQGHLFYSSYFVGSDYNVGGT